MATAQATCSNLSELGARFRAASRISASATWTFAQSVMAYKGENPKTKDADIGAACAAAVKRTAPYHKSVVGRWIKAAKAFGSEPATDSDRTRFTDVFWGNVVKSVKSGKASASADDALKGAIAFAKLAAKRGADVADIESAIHDALAGDADADEDAEAEAA